MDETLFVCFCGEIEQGLPILGPIDNEKAFILNKMSPDWDQNPLTIKNGSGTLM